MCGIFGCLRKNNNINIIDKTMTAIQLLKNRGYDSCGIYLNDTDSELLFKLGIDGQIINNYDENNIFTILEQNIKSYINSYISLSHTRWATHGGKTDYNAHPHESYEGRYVIVHNGTVSNYKDLQNQYLQNIIHKSETDSEVIINLISIMQQQNEKKSFLKILEETMSLIDGTYACIIYDKTKPNKLYFIKNATPLLIGKNEDLFILTSEPSGFLNIVDEYILPLDRTCGYVDSSENIIHVNGTFYTLKLNKNSIDDIKIPDGYDYWMEKEIYDQSNIDILKNNKYVDYYNKKILFNFENIAQYKYLYILACGSSLNAARVAENYFRFTKAFEFIIVIDASNFNKTYLDTINDPVNDLLVLIISQSGETRDLDIAVTICRGYTANETKIGNYDKKILNSNDATIDLLGNNEEKHENNNQIMIIGIINVVDSLLSRRTVHNIYTKSGRENAVAATKSCTSQILSCLYLAIYKSLLNDKLTKDIERKFFNDLYNLQSDINNVLSKKKKIEQIAIKINSILVRKNINSLFILGKDELNAVASEGCLKIKEVSYIHAESHFVAGFKHGVYSLVHDEIPIIVLYKSRNHFIKSVISEIETRNGTIFEITQEGEIDENDNNIIIPRNSTFHGILTIVVIQLLSYYLSIINKLNPDYPRNLAKTCTTD